MVVILKINKSILFVSKNHAAGMGETINNQYLIENCLKPVVKALEIGRPNRSGTKNLKILHDNAQPHVHKNVKKYYIKKSELFKLPKYIYRDEFIRKGFWPDTKITSPYFGPT